MDLKWCTKLDIVYRRGAALLFKVSHQISRSHGLKNRRFESSLNKITWPVALSMDNVYIRVTSHGRYGALNHRFQKLITTNDKEDKETSNLFINLSVVPHKEPVMRTGRPWHDGILIAPVIILSLVNTGDIHLYIIYSLSRVYKFVEVVIPFRWNDIFHRHNMPLCNLQLVCCLMGQTNAENILIRRATKLTTSFSDCRFYLSILPSIRIQAEWKSTN